MSYIGNQPATSFETVQKQISTSNSGTTITLDRAVTSVQDILLTIDAVVQSYDNYSVSGTTLTVGGTLSNNRVEILYVGRTMQSVDPTDDSVSAAKIKTDAVTTAKIQNDAVTKDKVDFVTDSGGASLEAKGSSGYDGAIRLNCSVNSHFTELKSASHGSYSGNLNFTLPSSTGTNGQFLQTNGSGVLSFANAGGDFVRLNSVTGTGLSDITFDNFSSTYQVYKIIGSHTMSSDNAQTRMRVRKSGTDQTSSHYRYAFSYAYRTSGGSGASYNTSWNADHVRITQGSSSADAHPTGFEFTIYSPSDSTRQSACWLNSFFYESGGANSWESWTGSIWLDSSTGVDITGIKFYPESGNFNNAKYSIYALKDS